MIIHAAINSNKTDILIQEFLKLRSSGVSADEILVLVQNGRKKNYFVQKIKEQMPKGNIGTLNICSFFALARNTIIKNWPIAQNMIKDKNSAVFANLCGLEVSSHIFSQCIKEVEFKGYNSKVNLLHQLFRRHSLIVQNALSESEIKLREKILKESFGQDVSKAINLYKLQTLNYRAFDYLRQISIFEYLYKNTKNPFKYVIIDDADEITPACFEYLKHIKPDVSEFYIASDPLGSSRLGYLSAVHIDFEKFLNQKAVSLPQNNSEAKKLFNPVKSKVPVELDCVQSASFVRRDEMIDKTISIMQELIKNGVKPSDIAIVTPLSDSFIRYSLKKLKQKVFFLTGSEKLNQNPCVGSVIEILKIINSNDYHLSPFVLKSIALEILHFEADEAIEISQAYREANYVYKTGIIEFLTKYNNSKANELLAFIQSIKEKSLSTQLYEICTKYITQSLDNQNSILKLNKFAKQISDFEEVFKDSFSKLKLIEQLENTIISENALSEEEIPQDAIIVSSAQKLIDSGINAKYLFLLDASNSDWIKQDIGMLYNSWVFQKNWNKESFELEDNLELTLDRTARILYKLCLLAQEKIFVFSSIYDSLGIENYGAIDKFFKSNQIIQNAPKKIIPRDDQKEVLEYKSGKMAVSAVAGSGKTTIMLALILKLLEGSIIKDIKSENIFVLTFMESAARNFRERIKQTFPDMVELPQISTIHGLALRLLKENNNYTFVNLDNDFEIIDENKKYEILGKILVESGLEHDKTDLYDRAISDFKNDGQDIRNVKSPSFKIVYKKYRQELNDNNFVDYDDLLILALKLLKSNSNVAGYYQNLARVIIEDEAQDSSPIQQELIKILSAGHGSIIRCGDVNQAITATFSNSDVKGFKQFIKENKNVQMDCSQRCGIKILDFANKIIDFSKQSAPEAFLDIKMRPVGEKNSNNAQAVNLALFDKEIEEKNFIIEQIKKIRLNCPNSSIGVLLRSNKAISIWAEFIERHNLKTVKNADFLINNPVFRISLAIFNFINDPRDKKTVAKCLETLLEIPKYKYEFDILDYANLNNFLDTKGSKYQLWWDLKYFLLKNYITPMELVLEIADFYFKDSIEKANAAMVYSIVDKTYKTYKTYEDCVRRLNEISNKINKSTKFFLNQSQEPDEGTINLMTLHKSKGAEFDYVFIPELTSDNLGLELNDIKLKKNTLFMQNVKSCPKNENELKQEILDENFRLLYVGITRAKEQLYLSCAKSYRFYKKEQPKKPCSIFNIREARL